jgi:hydroxymethylglutaryl-CoA synthase
MLNIKRLKSVGIVGYGAYVPSFRIAVEAIGRQWQKDGLSISQSLGVIQKAVADFDEDCLTMAVEAALQALKIAGIKPEKIGACFIGSESFPYAVKPSGVTLAQALGMDKSYFTADLQFACKAGTAGIQIIAGLIEAGMIDYGLAVGSDKAQGRPGDALEYTAGSGAAAFILGRNKKEWLAELKYTSSYNSDTPDFWRRAGQEFPSHAGRFTGEPAYFRHIVESTEIFMKKLKKKPQDFNYAIFHSPNKKFPGKAGKELGFKPEQMKYSLLVEQIGNPYSASAMISLVNVLDQAKAGEKILMTSYGSGAGSDNFFWQTTVNLIKKRKKNKKLIESLKTAIPINYGEYLRKMRIL